MRSRHTHLVLSAAAVATAVSLAASANAATYDWNNTGAATGTTPPLNGDTWGKGSNWSISGTPQSSPPGSNDIANLPAYATLAGNGPVINASAVYGIGGIIVDNSSAPYTIGFGGSGVGTILSIGSSGITASGGGTVSIQPVVSIAADQTWSVGTGTTIAFTRAFDAGGNGSLIKTGGGTIIAPAGTSNRTGTLTINGGIARTSFTNGFGGGTITVNSGGTLELASGFNSSTASNPNIQLNDGATLRGFGNGTVTDASINKAGGLLALPSGASIRLEGGTSTTTGTLATNQAFTGGSSSSVITIGGSGSVILANGGAYNGSWKVESGTLLLTGNGALSGRPVTLSGGETILQAANSQVTFNSVFTVDGTATLTADKSAAGSLQDRTISGLTMNGGTLTAKLGNNVTSVTSTGTPYFGNTPFKVNTLTLNTNTSSVLNVSQGSIGNTVATLGIAGSGNLEKIGAGTLQVNGTSTNTGQIKVSAGTMYLGGSAANGLGSTSKLTIGSAGTVWMNQFGTNADVLALPGDLAGDGILKVGNTGIASTTITGAKTIAPTGDTGGAAVLDLQSKLTASTSGSGASTQYVSLAIDVLGNNATAGSDYDQLNITGGAVSGINAMKLLVSIGGLATQAGLNGDVLTILNAPGVNFSGTNFANVTSINATTGTLNLVGMGTAQVNYNNGSITLSNISVPEPASLAAIGLVAGGVLRRRRKA